MKKFILIPDSFKGTMSAQDICDILRGEILAVYSDAEILSIPVADGGEGSVDCFLTALSGEKVTLTASNPFFEKMESFYGLIDSGRTAVIEMAACAGLPLAEGRKDPRVTTTYGVGELMLNAAQRGVKKIILGLGGSATNDGGCGAACAAGIRFLDTSGAAFVPTGGTLNQIAAIDRTGFDKAFDGIQIITMCDIDNPLTGKNGAAYIFGPQKGATPEIVEELDSNLAHLAKRIQADLGADIADIKGAGAAGGMGGGMVAFFGSRLQMGIETVLDIVDFDSKVVGADLVFSGEGKIDSQSLRGKVVLGVAKKTKKAGVPLVAIVGDIGDDIGAVYDAGVSGIFSINRVAVEFPAAKKRAKSDLALTMQNLMQFYRTILKD